MSNSPLYTTRVLCSTPRGESAKTRDESLSLYSWGVQLGKRQILWEDNPETVKFVDNAIAFPVEQGTLIRFAVRSRYLASRIDGASTKWLYMLLLSYCEPTNQNREKILHLLKKKSKCDLAYVWVKIVYVLVVGVVAGQIFLRAGLDLLLWGAFVVMALLGNILLSTVVRTLFSLHLKRSEGAARGSHQIQEMNADREAMK